MVRVLSSLVGLALARRTFVEQSTNLNAKAEIDLETDHQTDWGNKALAKKRAHKEVPGSSFDDEDGSPCKDNCVDKTNGIKKSYVAVYNDLRWCGGAIAARDEKLGIKVHFTCARSDPFGMKKRHKFGIGVRKQWFTWQEASQNIMSVGADIDDYMTFLETYYPEYTEKKLKEEAEHDRKASDKQMHKLDKEDEKSEENSDKAMAQESFLQTDHETDWGKKKKKKIAETETEEVIDEDVMVAASATEAETEKVADEDFIVAVTAPETEVCCLCYKESGRKTDWMLKAYSDDADADVNGAGFDQCRSNRGDGESDCSAHCAENGMEMEGCMKGSGMKTWRAAKTGSDANSWTCASDTLSNSCSCGGASLLETAQQTGWGKKKLAEKRAHKEVPELESEESLCKANCVDKRNGTKKSYVAVYNSTLETWCGGAIAVRDEKIGIKVHYTCDRADPFGTKKRHKLGIGVHKEWFTWQEASQNIMSVGADIDDYMNFLVLYYPEYTEKKLKDQAEHDRKVSDKQMHKLDKEDEKFETKVDKFAKKLDKAMASY